VASQITHNDIGDVWQPRFTFKVNNVLTDPSNVTFKLGLPDGTIETVGPTSGAAPSGTSTHITGITRNGAGDYTLSISLDASGYWLSKASGTGAAVGSETWETIVDPDPFTANSGVSTRALVGLYETKAWLASTGQDTTDDLTVVRLINAVSDEVHRFTGREFKVSGTNPQTRTFDVDRVAQRYGYVNVGDMTSFTSVQTVDTDWATVLETVPTASIQALPLVRATGDPIRALRVNFTLGSLTWRGGYQVKVTGNFGFPSVPEDVRHAVMDTIAYRRDRDVEHPRDTLSAVPGVNDAGAAVVLAAQPRILAFPPDVYATLIKYRAPVVG
jgi:hypothetical protein